MLILMCIAIIIDQENSMATSIMQKKWYKTALSIFGILGVLMIIPNANSTPPPSLKYCPDVENLRCAESDGSGQWGDSNCAVSREDYNTQKQCSCKHEGDQYIYRCNQI